MRTRTRIGLLAALLVGVAGCSSTPELDAVEQGHLADGSEQIYYRGEPRVAQRFGKLLVIEGDIDVSPADQWGPDDAEAAVGDGAPDGVGVAAQAVRIQGASFQWPGGTVPFTFGSYATGSLSGALTAAQQQSIQAAMDAWEEAVPGLDFRARTNNDANFITFNLSTQCSSRVGRNPGDNEVAALAGEQLIRLTAGCISVFSVHHEIAHALGIFHEQTRKDASSFVQINWANIQGCTNTATGPTVALGCGGCTTANAANCGCTAAQVSSNNCNMFTNFVTDNRRADIGSYDYDSVMHYPSTAFTKSGGITLAVLQNDDAGNPLPIGQRDHLSDRDQTAMNTLYPVLNMQSVFFRGTGTQALCKLRGRDGDRKGTRFTVTGNLPSNRVGSTSGDLDTNVSEGAYSADCSAGSTYWAGNYDYPNSSVSFDTSQPAANVEVYDTAARTVQVLSAGLIPVLFGT